jgi:hypothetical protein
MMRENPYRSTGDGPANWDDYDDPHDEITEDEGDLGGLWSDIRAVLFVLVIALLGLTLIVTVVL